MSYTLITVAACYCDRPQCPRYGIRFLSRTDQPPARCPYCGSKKWNALGKRKEEPYATPVRSAVDSGTHTKKGESINRVSEPLQPESAGGRKPVGNELTYEIEE